LRALAARPATKPHGETVPADNPHLIRSLGAVKMPDGTIVTNAGFGAICLHAIRTEMARRPTRS